MPFPSKKDQFSAGRSGNPTGSSKAQRITGSLLELITERNADKSLALVWLKKALEGDRHFFRYLLDRVDGPVKLEIQATDAAADDVQAIRDFLAAEIDKPAKRKRRRKADEQG